MLDLFQQLFGRKSSSGDSIVTMHLEGALVQPGCPFCRLAGAGELRYFESLLYENVDDPGVNEQLLASRGFCTEHTWVIPTAPPAHQSPFGLAILFGRLTAALLRHVRGDAELERWLHPTAPCPVCLVRDDITQPYLAEYARLIADSSATGGAGPSVVCQPHLRDLARYLDARRHAALAEAAARAVEVDEGEWRLALVAGRQPSGRLPTVPACPACAAARQSSAAVPTTAARCRYHAWELGTDGRSAGADDVRAVVPMVDCAACRVGIAAAETLIGGLDEGHHLCLGHVRLALRGRRPVRATAVAALARLNADLVRFRDSFDYQFAGTLAEAERSSWLTALARFGGESIGSAVARARPFAELADRANGERRHHDDGRVQGSLL